MKDQFCMTSWRNTVLHKSFKELTYILESSVSCIDLVFTSQEHLVSKSGDHSSLHPNCHHQIVFSNFNLKIHYPPPYERLIWKYEKANADLVKRAIKDFDLENKLSLIGINSFMTEAVIIWKPVH